MRNDMYKVIIDLPRLGSSMRNRKSRFRLSGKQVNSWSVEEVEDYDSGPAKLPMSQGCKYDSYNTKGQSDRFGPLRRFLRSCVGRKWNSVHSEIAMTLDNRSIMRGGHFWTHVYQLVELDCTLGENGKIYHQKSYGGRILEFTSGFYVHPETLTLEYKERKNRKFSKKTERLFRKLRELGVDGFTAYSYKPEMAVNFRIVDNTFVLERKNGIWYGHKYEKYQLGDFCGWKYNREGMPVPVYFTESYPKKYKKILTFQLGKKDLAKHRNLIAGSPY